MSDLCPSLPKQILPKSIRIPFTGRVAGRAEMHDRIRVRSLQLLGSGCAPYGTLCSANIHRGHRGPPPTSYFVERSRPLRRQNAVSELPVSLTPRMSRTALLLARDLLHFVVLTFIADEPRSREPVPAQATAFCVERKVRPRRLNDAARITLVSLARLIDWRQLLVVVRSETLVRWHRQGFRILWRWKSRRPGRPRIDMRTIFLGVKQPSAGEHGWQGPPTATSAPTDLCVLARRPRITE
jgi:hypothetical protein